MAIGNGFPFVVGDRVAERVNKSEIHIDYMVGSDEMTVTGMTADGDRVPVLDRGRWRL